MISSLLYVVALSCIYDPPPRTPPSCVATGAPFPPRRRSRTLPCSLLTLRTPLRGLAIHSLRTAMRRFRRTTVVFIDLVSIAHTFTRRSHWSAAVHVTRSSRASSAAPSLRILSCPPHHTPPLSLPSPFNIIGPFPFAVTPIDTDMCPYSPPSEPPFFTFPHYLILDASSVAVALCLKSAQSWPARAGQRRPCTYTHIFHGSLHPPSPSPFLSLLPFPSSRLPRFPPIPHPTLARTRPPRHHSQTMAGCRHRRRRLSTLLNRTDLPYPCATASIFRPLSAWWLPWKMYQYV